jgi:chitodextrinase
MVRILQLLMAAALAALIAVPTTASAATPQDVTLTGTYSSVHEDAQGTFAEQDRHFLVTADARYELQFAGRTAPEGETGAEITVTGRLAGHTLIVGTDRSALRIRKQGPVSTIAAASAGLPTGATASSADSVAPMTSGGAIATAKVAAVLINLTDLKTEPYTTSQVASALYGSGASAKAFFEEESKGRMTMTGAVFGWYTIDSTTTGCNWNDWVTKGTAAANAAGANLSAYTHVMFITPNTTQCGYAGLGYVPGTVTVLNGTLSVQVMTHELGHNFGLSHANGIDCSVNGTRVALSTAANCTESVYADPFGTMGNNAMRHNPASQLGELGWLSASEKVEGAPGNSYTVTPYFSSGGVHLVRIPRGDGTFFDIDFRMTYGVIDTFTAGSPAVSGATIHLGWGTASPTNSPHAIQLIDTTPATGTLADAPLALNKTFTDPVSSISITTTSVSAMAVQVRVREGVDPSAPASFAATPAADGTSVALAWAAATDNVAVADYKVTRNGAEVATLAATARAWTDSSVAPGTDYAYAVLAEDTSGNASVAASASVTTPGDPAATPTPTSSPDPVATPSPDPTATPAPTPNPDDTQAPTAPEPLDGTPATTSVALTWGASSDDFGVTGYVVSRNGSPVATVKGTSWTDTGRAPNTAYTYSVAAIDTGLNHSDASTIQITTAADTKAPTAPRNFHRVRQSGRYVTFAWSRASDNVKVAAYYVYRVGRVTPIARTTHLSIRFRTTRGATYYVRAVDTTGNHSSISYRVRVRF